MFNNCLGSLAAQLMLPLQSSTKLWFFGFWPWVDIGLSIIIITESYSLSWRSTLPSSPKSKDKRFQQMNEIFFPSCPSCAVGRVLSLGSGIWRYWILGSRSRIPDYQIPNPRSHILRSQIPDPRCQTPDLGCGILDPRIAGIWYPSSWNLASEYLGSKRNL